MDDQNTIPLFYSSLHLGHAPQIEFLNGTVVEYAERPQRIEKIREKLQASGLVHVIEPQTLISRAELALVHRRGMIDYLEHVSHNIDRYLIGPSFAPSIRRIMPEQDYFYPYVFPPKSSKKSRRVSGLQPHQRFYCFDLGSPIGRHTWAAARAAATVAAEGASWLLQRRARTVYALCRPPGHHAGPDFFGGYCYLNNAAIATRRLLEEGKVAIVDIDYHHGNGTQAIFWQNPRVFFGSIHADPGIDYPFYSGFGDEIGGHKARWTNLNLPLTAGADSFSYLCALERILNCVSDFGADFLVVSLGFDAFEADPYGLFKLTVKDYQTIGAQFARLGLPTLLVQEGGYAVDALGVLACALIEGVLGRPVGQSGFLSQAEIAQSGRRFRATRPMSRSRASMFRIAMLSGGIGRRRNQPLARLRRGCYGRVAPDCARIE